MFLPKRLFIGIQVQKLVDSTYLEPFAKNPSIHQRELFKQYGYWGNYNKCIEVIRRFWSTIRYDDSDRNKDDFYGHNSP